jgi:hypothetical protein
MISSDISPKKNKIQLFSQHLACEIKGGRADSEKNNISRKKPIPKAFRNWNAYPDQ